MHLVDESDAVPVRSMADLLEYFESAGKPAAQWRVATDASLRAELIETGRHVRQTEFSLSRMLAVLDGVYCDVLGPRVSGLRRSETQGAAVPRCAVTSYSAELPLPG